MRATRWPRTVQNVTAIALPIGLTIFVWMWLTRPVKWPGKGNEPH